MGTKITFRTKPIKRKAYNVSDVEITKNDSSMLFEGDSIFNRKQKKKSFEELWL